MRELSEFLTENELYVFFNHPAKPYRVLACELGLSQSRIQQLKHDAKRKIRKEKHREQVALQAKKKVDLTLERGDIHVLHRALWAYAADLTDMDMRKKQPVEEDSDYKIVKKLIPYMQSILSEE